MASTNLHTLSPEDTEHVNDCSALLGEQPEEACPLLCESALPAKIGTAGFAVTSNPAARQPA